VLLHGLHANRLGFSPKRCFAHLQFLNRLHLRHQPTAKFRPLVGDLTIALSSLFRVSSSHHCPVVPMSSADTGGEFSLKTLFQHLKKKGAVLLSHVGICLAQTVQAAVGGCCPLAQTGTDFAAHYMEGELG
jgi:hypothetical protein